MQRSPTLRDLAELTGLDRTLLTVFVFGPGEGEGILVALPGTGWIAIDGAQVGSRFPLLEVLRRYKGAAEPIDAVVLTHPHRDHYRGIVELLDDGALGAAVRCVGCVALYVEGLERNSADLEMEALAATVDPVDPLARLGAGGARRILERIRTEWSEHPDRRLPLFAGSFVPLGAKDVQARVLAPDRGMAERLFGSEGPSGRLLERANELSAAMEISYGSTRVLLGADLPAAVATGWSRVAAGEKMDLGQHVCLKVPHHGSPEALAPQLLALPPGGQAGRTWVVTPFSSKELPSFEPGKGIDLLLAGEPALHLCAFPARWRMPLPVPAVVHRSEVKPALVGIHGSLGALGQPVQAGNDPTMAPEDCAWALQFDRDAHLVGRFRGRAAAVVEQ